MHCITGVALEEHAEVLTRYVLKNYRVLKRIVLVYLSNTPDIRLYYQLSEAASFQLKDIILVCSQNLHANTSLDLS